MRRVVWSMHAHNDFRDLVGYIAEDNPAAAHDIAARIDHTIRALAATPTGRKGRVNLDARQIGQQGIQTDY